jgi:hypothetical protein
MDHAKCDACPAAGRCVVDWTGHITYCRWADRGGAHRDKVIELSAQGPPATTTAEFPSLARQAANLTGAVGRVIGAALTGQRVNATPEEIAEREAKCVVCPHLVESRCALCGCAYRTKISKTTERCPIGRWEKIEL